MNEMMNKSTVLGRKRWRMHGWRTRFKRIDHGRDDEQEHDGSVGGYKMEDRLY
jgi:hypothetical protein